MKPHVALEVAAESFRRRRPIDFKPPPEVVAAAKEAIDLVRAGFAGRGLLAETVRWVRRVARGEPVDAAKALKGWSYHRRHAVDRRPGWEGRYKVVGGKRSWTRRPTPGYVAYMAWFGAPGKKWFTDLRRQILKRSS